MQLVTETAGAVDLAATPIHLGRGSTARAVEGFAWDAAVLAAYGEEVAGDGPEGRMVMLFDGADDWTSWERHPAGDEVVLCVSGHLTLIRALAACDDRIELGPGQAAVNPAGVWHTADVREPTRFLTITPGAGTEHCPRQER